jgi:hypothetical protein
MAEDGWRLYPKLGDLVVRAADQIVWLDLPIRIWLPRLIRGTARRLLTCEELWNGNRESLRSVIEGRDSLFVYALRSHRERHLRDRLRCPINLRLVRQAC